VITYNRHASKNGGEKGAPLKDEKRLPHATTGLYWIPGGKSFFTRKISSTTQHGLETEKGKAQEESD